MGMAVAGSAVAAAALAGMKACAAAKINEKQIKAMRCAFETVYALCCYWEMFFPDKYSSEEVSSAKDELEKMVHDACWLVREYSDDWRAKAFFSHENKQGFRDSFERLWKHVEFVNSEISSTSIELAKTMEDKVLIDGILIRKMLEDGAKHDKEALDRMEQVRIVRDLLSRRDLSRDPEDEQYRSRKIFNIIPSFKKSRDLVVDLNQMLGKGQFGKVYRGTYMGFTVAIKQLSEDDCGRFNKESMIMAAFQESPHPNVVSIAGMRHREIIMEIMDSNLEDFLVKRNRPLQPVEAVDIMIQVANGMAYVHRKKVCYRDLKLLNILVKNGPMLKVKLADFGEAKADFRSLDCHTSPVGSLLYMAPEILDTQGKYTKMADVFSYGIASSEILTGRPLSRDPNYQVRKARSMPERLNMYKRHMRPPLPEDCSTSLRRLVNECWNIDPAKRPTFETILNRLWEIKREILVGATTSDVEGLFSPASSPNSMASSISSPGAFGIRDGNVEEEEEADIEADIVSHLTIHGQNKVGSILRADWNATRRTRYAVQWERSRKVGSEFQRVASTPVSTDGTSSDYSVTPDDNGFYIGIECQPLETPGKCYRYCLSSPISLDEKMERAMEDTGHSFSVRIDKQLIKGELQLCCIDYRLSWGMIDRRNFRDDWTTCPLVEVPKSQDPLICRLTRGSGPVFTLKFDTLYKRNLAVLVMRKYLESPIRL